MQCKKRETTSKKISDDGTFDWLSLKIDENFSTLCDILDCFVVLLNLSGIKEF
jgi:hypothetical protein